MKAKAKMNGAQVKDLLKAHVEKIGFGVVLVGFGILAYSAIGVEPYDKTPQELATAAQQAQQHIERTVTSAELQQALDADGQLVVRNYADKATVVTVVNPTKVTGNVPQLLPSESTTGRRPEPEYLALEQLRAAAGNGTFAMRMSDKELAEKNAQFLTGTSGGISSGGLDETGRPISRGPRGGTGGLDETGRPLQRPGGDGFDNLLTPGVGRDGKFGGPAETEQDRVEPPLVTAPQDSKSQGFRWVVLTGLAPVNKQLAEYRAKFEDIGQFLPERDNPQYTFFEVERAPFVPGEPDASRDWKTVEVVENSIQIEQEFAVEYPMDCDDLYRDPILTRLLPPLLGRNWGKVVVHEPEIKMLNLATYGLARGGEEAEDDGRSALLDGADGAEMTAREKMLLGQGGAMGARYGGSGSDDGGRSGGRRMNRSRNPYANMPTARRNPYANMRGGHGGDGGFAGMQVADYVLFRFFDFSVQPGERYVYRVRLELSNPNYGLPSYLLETSELAHDEFKQTPWTVLPEPVTVPGDSYLLAGGVTPPRGANEPRARAIIKSFNQEKGIEATQEFSLQRGDIAGGGQRSVKLINPITRQIEDAQLEFSTETLVLDILGGESLETDRSEKVPGMMLLQDASGRLFVRGELSDQKNFDAAVQELDLIKDVVKPKKPDKDDAYDALGRPKGGGLDD